MTKKHKHPPFVMVTNQVLDAAAWRAMSTGARVLYVSLKRRYSPNYKNNGRIYLSQRRAAAEIGSSTNQITRWFRELQHYGFIVQTKPGYLGLEGKGRAAHWRLTEVAYMRGTSSKGMDDMPTMDFLKWNGVRFRVRKGIMPTPLPGTHRYDRKAIDAALDRLSGLSATNHGGFGI
jgi:hypothetical protein